MQKSAYNAYAHFKLKYLKNFKSYGNGGCWWWVYNSVDALNSTELYN